MLEQIESFLARNYKPLNVLVISQRKLIANYNYLSSFGLQIAPVLKSNAYGHGLTQVATILDVLKPPFFCVDSLYEAYELYKANIVTPILVMGYVSPESLRTKHLPFSFALYTKQQLHALKKYQPRSKIHLFVDTGMHREGFLLEELGEILSEIKKSGICLEGIMSHFAESENPDVKLTREQEKNFLQAITIVKKYFSPKYIHFANSSGILKNKEFSYLGNMARAGISLYGIDPSRKNSTLKPVLEFRTKIAQIKTLMKGEHVGYNFTYRTKKTTKVAILPAGYNDGVDRALSNKGFVKVKGKFCTIIGKVSMNITAIDVSKVSNIREDDEVIVYSGESKDLNSIQEAAKIAKVIPYQLLVHLHASTKRVIV